MNIDNKSEKFSFLRHLIVYVCGFVLIYYTNVLPNVNPYLFPLLGFSVIMVMEIIDRRNSIFVLASRKKYLRFIIGLIAAALYYALVYFFMNEQTSFYGSRIVQSLMFVVYFFLALYYIKKVHIMYPTRGDKLELLFRIATIQGLICIAMLMIPALKHVADHLFAMSSNFEAGDYILQTRVFGLSNSYTYGLPIFHGLLSGLCFYMSIMINKKYFKYLPFIFIVSLLNGRTGIIVAITTMLFSLLYAFCVSKNKFRAIRLFVTFSAASILVLSILSSIFPRVYNFINLAFNGIGEYVSGGEANASIKSLTGDSIYFPDGIKFIFGEGVRVYASVNTSQYPSSDIGYINDFFMGGLIYAILIYGTYFGLIMSSYDDREYRFVKFIILISFVLANWKGEIFKNSLFIIGVFFILLADVRLDEYRDGRALCPIL